MSRILKTHLMRLRTMGLIAAFALGLGAPARAGFAQFASFTTASGTPFNFTNLVTSGVLGNGANAVNFQFDPATGLSQLGYTATVSFGGGTNAPATLVGGMIDQPLNLNDTITFTDLNSGKILLSAVFTGDITGASGSLSPTLGSTSAANTLVYSSQFLPSSFFSNPSGFTITLPASSGLSIGPGGFINSFASFTASGQFSTTFTLAAAPVPEPSSLAMGGVAGAIGLVLARRRHGRPA